MPKKVYYNGDSQVIQALCQTTNDIIDGGGGGGSVVTITPTIATGTKTADYTINGVSGELYAPTPPTKTSDLQNDSGFVASSDVAILKDANNDITTTLTKADNGITFVNDEVVFSDALSMDRGDGTNVTVIDRSYTDIHNHSTDIYDEVGNVLLHHEYHKDAVDEWEKTILQAIVNSGGISKIIFKTGTHEVSVPYGVDGVLALTSDIPTRLSQLTDDVVSGNYLPLSGGTMTGPIKATSLCMSQNTSPSFLITMDTFASGGQLKFASVSDVSVGNASKLGNASASISANASTIVKRNASGYIYGVYFNQSSADETATFDAGGVSYVWYAQGDGFFRKVQIGEFYDTMHRAYFRNGSGSYNFGYTTGNVGSLGGQLISYNSTASGYTRMYASAFNSPSCKWLKENVEDIPEEDALKVLELRPVYFDYKEPYGEKNQQGLIAEEAYEVLPKIVTKGENWDMYADAENEEAINENFMDVSGDIPGIEYSAVVPYLIKLAQVQDKRITELENKIRELEGKE